MLGVAATAFCRSDREKDLHGEKFGLGVGGDADNSLLGDLDLLPFGGRGGRRRLGDDEFKLELSLLLLLSELLIITARANELLLELVSLFDMPPPLPLELKLRFLSQKLL